MIDTVEKCCPICKDEKYLYLFEIQKSTIVKCFGCGLLYAKHQSSLINDTVTEQYNYPFSSTWTEGKTETEASKKYVEMLFNRLGKTGRVLLIAPHKHCFAALAKERGFDVVNHMDIRDFEKGIAVEPHLDAVVFLYQLEKSFMISNVLDRAYELLDSHGVLLVVTPSLDSPSARFLGSSWAEWRPENRYFFDYKNILSLCLRKGFNEIDVNKDVRWYTLAHFNERAASFPQTWQMRLINWIFRMVPSSLHSLRLLLPTSGMVVLAQKTGRRERPLLSVILPVYNESATFPILMEQLVNKNIDGIDKEIIIIESNSSDNSRQLVLVYKNRPDVKIILQDKARGKGNAVRQGFEHASGDILLIQDADLEYDLNDYEALLAPVASYKHAFVLGSRHGGRWKMRHFDDQQQLSAYLNFGHVLFTTMINLLYGQHLKDPFTMFKVFRRECLYNLYFECNRFDFDYELVIKLIRKGYVPVEIPVNYKSRSFQEGKKIDMYRDPLTWIKAIFKYRFAKITK